MCARPTSPSLPSHSASAALLALHPPPPPPSLAAGRQPETKPHTRYLYLRCLQSMTCANFDPHKCQMSSWFPCGMNCRPLAERLLSLTNAAFRSPGAISPSPMALPLLLPLLWRHLTISYGTATIASPPIAPSHQPSTPPMALPFFSSYGSAIIASPAIAPSTLLSQHCLHTC